jgi:hypothetical protein
MRSGKTEAFWHRIAILPFRAYSKSLPDHLDREDFAKNDCLSCVTGKEKKSLPEK